MNFAARFSGAEVEGSSSSAAFFPLRFLAGGGAEDPEAAGSAGWDDGPGWGKLYMYAGTAVGSAAETATGVGSGGVAAFFAREPRGFLAGFCADPAVSEVEDRVVLRGLLLVALAGVVGSFGMTTGSDIDTGSGRTGPLPDACEAGVHVASSPSLFLFLRTMCKGVRSKYVVVEIE